MSEVVDVSKIEEKFELDLGVELVLLLHGALGIEGLGQRGEHWRHDLVVKVGDEL